MARLFQCLGVTGCSVSWTASPRTADTALLQVFYPLSGWVGHLTNEMRTQMRTSDHVLITKADKQKGSIRVQALFPGSQMLTSPQSKHITWLKDTPSCQWEDLKTCIVKGKDAERMKIWAGDVNAVAVVQLPRCVQLSVTPWTAARQASLFLIMSQSLPKFMLIESVMPSGHLTLWYPLLLPSVFPSIRDFCSESAVHIRWPKYWSFSCSISPITSHKLQGIYWSLRPWFPGEEGFLEKKNWASIFPAWLLDLRLASPHLFMRQFLKINLCVCMCVRVSCRFCFPGACWQTQAQPA